jgi:arabinan endo-1,5-alpha-L-arabinosidase
LYYSVSGFGKNTSGIGVTVNKTLNPRAPDYKLGRPGHGAAVGAGRDDWNAIDPNIVEDDKGGTWMAFGSFWSGIKLVKLDASLTGWPSRRNGTRSPAASARQIGARRAGGAGEIEAPFIFKKNGYYYLFVSWGLCCRKGEEHLPCRGGPRQDRHRPYLDRSASTC